MSKRKASYASEVMLRVSWSVLNHEDGQPQHARRGEVMLDLGLERAPIPELSPDEMQRVAFAAKMATLKLLRQRKSETPKALVGCEVVLKHETSNGNDQVFLAGSRAVVQGTWRGMFHLDFKSAPDGQPMTGHLRMVYRDMFERVHGTKP